MSVPIWTKDPAILMNKASISQVWPTSTMSNTEKLNAITRIVILLVILGYMVSHSIKYILIGVITLIIIAGYYQYNNKTVTKEAFRKAIKEGFTNPILSNQASGKRFTPPTNANPMMNVLLPELNGNPNRKPAAPAFNRIVEKNINDKVKENVIKEVKDSRLFRGINNELEFDLSMRNFYTTANTTVPNDQEGFAEFCYGDMISAKEGNEWALAKHNPRLGSIPGG